MKVVEESSLNKHFSESFSRRPNNFFHNSHLEIDTRTNAPWKLLFHNKGPLILLLATVVGNGLVIQQSISIFATASASESSPYESGRDHGCDDAGISDPDDRYINQPEKGPSFHTDEFMAGYNDGFDNCSGQESPPSDDDGHQTSGERYYDGVLDWGEACNDLDNFISEPCSNLVTSDGLALTAEGKETLERIACQGGALVGILAGDVISLLQGLRC